MLDTLVLGKKFLMWHKEINELTDINVYFEQITKGRKVIKLKIDIVAKLPMEKMLTSCHNDELLGAYQDTFG